LIDNSLEQAVELTMSEDHSQIMLCGNPEMINESLEILKARGFKKNRRCTLGQLTREAYW
jgi:ferredoxin/flavodoxin---NADP+ reductase